MTASNDELQILLDERAIREVIYRYCRGIDRRQFEDVRSCYHPGATDHHGDFFGGIDAFIDFVTARIPGFESSMHFVGNVYIEVAGDTARCESYVFALARIAADAEQPARDNLVALRYVDDFRRIDGTWAIMHRKCVYESTRTDPVPAGWTFTPYHLLGRPDRQDTVYAERLDDVPAISGEPEIRAL